MVIDAGCERIGLQSRYYNCAYSNCASIYPLNFSTRNPCPASPDFTI